MRCLYPDSNAYADAARAVGNLKLALKGELKFFVNSWRPGKGANRILLMSDEEVKKLKGNGLYGSSEGMYLIDYTNDDNEMYFYLPKTTEAYNEFYSSIINYYENDDTLYYETIPNIIDVFFDGCNEVEIIISVNVEEMDKSGYESAVKLAKEIVDMLMATVYFEKISYYEGNADGNVGFENEHSNYFVGVNITYNIDE
ncbi:MAG: hypothetical protein K6B70_04470 [Clostridia bacterium]|nr:hypothetical protein [Clostridia bacterium]